MAEPVNFNKARKSREREKAEALAAENRIKFGRTKAEKDLAKARSEKARRDLDAGKREP